MAPLGDRLLVKPKQAEQVRPTTATARAPPPAPAPRRGRPPKVKQEAPAEPEPEPTVRETKAAAPVAILPPMTSICG